MKKSYYIGIDISKKTLDASIFKCEMEESRFPHIKVDNDKPGFKKIMKLAKQEKVDLSDCCFCMENTGHYGLDLCVFLEQNNIEYCSVCPLVVKRSMGIARDKNDKIDSARIATFAFEKGYKLKPSKLASEDIMNLKRLQSERATYVRQRASLKTFISDNQGSSTTKRMEAMVDEYTKQISKVEKEIRTIVEKNPEISRNYDLLISVPGVGKVVAITTLIHTNNFRSFDNARQYACYSGVAPFAHSSGTSVNSRPMTSRIGDRQIKSEISQGAMSALRNDAEMNAYYLRKLGEGKPAGVVLNAIKFKIIERMFAVVHRGTPYAVTHSFKTMKNTATGCLAAGAAKSPNSFLILVTAKTN